MQFAKMDLSNHEFAIALLCAGWPCTLFVAVFFLAYLVNLHRLVSRLQPSNRLLSFEEIWLLLMPVFNLFWIFRVLFAFDNAIFAELRYRRQMHEYYAVGKSIATGLLVWHTATGTLVGHGIVTSWCDAEEATYIFLFLQVPAYGIAAFSHMVYTATVTTLLNQSEPTA